MKDNGNMYGLVREAEALKAVEQEIASGVDEMTTSMQNSYNHIESVLGKEGASIFAGNGEINGAALQSLGTGLSELDFSNLQLADLQAMGFESFEDFKAAFEQASQNNPIQPKIDTESKYDFDNDEEIDSYLKDNTNIDRTTLDTATSSRIREHEKEGNRFDNGGTQEEVAQAEEQLAKARETYGQNSKEAAEAEQKVAEARKDSTRDTKLYEKALQRAAAAEARQIKTIEEMNEHFDDNRDVLENASSTSVEYAKALTETKKDLAGLLDVDMESLSDDFVANAHTLDLMKEAAQGNEEAFSELRNLAAQDIIQNLEINTVDAAGNSINAEDVRTTLTQMIDDLNAQNLGVDVEADIDTAE